MNPFLRCILLATILATSAHSQEQGFGTLSLERAVSLALEHHPSLRAASANLRSAASGLTQAEASYFPSLSASATFSRTDGAFVFNPDFPPRNQTYNNYSTGFQLNQTIFDFGRTIGKVASGSQFVEAATQDAEAVRCAVIANTEIAYFGYLQAREVVLVNEEAVAQSDRHLREAKAFVSVGARAQFDVTRAEVDLANANVGLIRARNQLQLAKLQLDNAMGMHLGPYEVHDSLSIRLFEISLDSAKALMFERRQELWAAKARVNANRSLVTAAWAQHLPTLSGFGTWTWSNFDFPLFSRWNAGVTFSLPLFQGFSVVAQVDQARANADAAEAALESLTESLLLETEQNYLGVREASERLLATSKLVEQAEQSLNLAERQYAAGVGSALEISDAQLTLSNARITRIQALYDYNSFLVRLQRSIGILAP
jgi:outer membrane protein TolC